VMLSGVQMSAPSVSTVLCDQVVAYRTLCIGHILPSILATSQVVLRTPGESLGSHPEKPPHFNARGVSLGPQSPLRGGGPGGAPPGEPRWLYVHFPAGAAPSQGTGRLRPRHPPDHGGESASVLCRELRAPQVDRGLRHRPCLWRRRPVLLCSCICPVVPL